MHRCDPAREADPTRRWFRVTRLTTGAGLVVALLLVTAVSGAAAVVISGNPNISVSLADGSVAPGEETALELVLSNDGELDAIDPNRPALTAELTTADGVAVTAEAEGTPVTVESGQQQLGAIMDGERATAGVDVAVPEDAEPGTYEMDVTVEYSHAERISTGSGVVNERSVTRHYTVDVTVEREDVHFSVVDVESTVRGGGSGDVAVTVEQDGRETARDVTVALRSLDAAVRPAGGDSTSRYVGDWPAGERRTLRYRVTAAEGLVADAHALELTATYEDGGSTRTSRGLGVGVTPATADRFALGVDAGALTVGGRGTLGVELDNGGEAVRDVRVRLEATSPAIRIDGGSEGTRAVGRVGSGERGRAGFAVAATDAAVAGNYTLTATVTYTDATGETVTTPSRPVTVSVGPEPTFEVTTADGTLSVGERSQLTGRIRNDGPVPVENAVLVVTTPPPGVQVGETSYPLGDLGVEEGAAFALTAGVPDGIAPGPRAATFAVQYETRDGTVRESGAVRTRVEVAPERDTFAVEPVNATFAPDSTDRLVVRVTNTADRPRTDVRASIRPTSPFTSAAPSAYVGRLEPGASRTVAFAIEVHEDAVETRHAIALNVTAENATGITSTERQRVPVQVTTASAPMDLGPLVVLGLLSVGILAGVGWWWRSRQ
jgi:hypothetical protein